MYCLNEWNGDRKGEKKTLDNRVELLLERVQLHRKEDSWATAESSTVWESTS